MRDYTERVMGKSTSSLLKLKSRKDSGFYCRLIGESLNLLDVMKILVAPFNQLGRFSSKITSPSRP